MIAPDISKVAPLGDLLAASIRDIDIPPRPRVLEKITDEMHREAPDFKRLTAIISADVSLGAGLIKTANSPYFGTRRHVRSVQEALLLLGLDIASRAIAGLSLREAFPPTPQLERFWDSSACIARISGWLTQHSQGNIRVPPEDAYTFGLFRDCGIPILIKRFPSYPALLQRANQCQEKSFTAIEEEAIPTNHAIVSCLLAQSWWLPEEICLALRNHHDATQLGSDSSTLPIISRGLIAHAQLAEYLIQRITGLCHTEEWTKLGALCLQQLGLTTGDIDKLLPEATAIIAAES
ncbi:MAG: HDOD domain-containing protein [Proteobacteria bacterium]|nr:HDOD domain-containing protein [Pseudomonadota bacterium]